MPWSISFTILIDFQSTLKVTVGLIFLKHFVKKLISTNLLFKHKLHFILVSNASCKAGTQNALDSHLNELLCVN